MSKKHRHSHQPDSLHRKKLGKPFSNDYNGYYPDTDRVETVHLKDIKSKDFYKTYIQSRKPVIIKGVIPGIDLAQFQPDRIVSTLSTDDEQMLLVEKKHQGGFGSGTERIKMTFEEFMEKLNGEDGDQYYLTTQYAEDDPDEIKETLSKKLEEDSEDDDEPEDGDESTPLAPPIANTDDFSDTDSIDFNDIHDDFDEMGSIADEPEEDEVISTNLPGEPLTVLEAERRVQEFVQKPLTSLVAKDSLPLRPKLLKKLVPQQINIWIGKSRTSDDSDFKPKATQPDLGLGRRIFGGGTSSGLHHDHADNLYVPISGSKRFTIFAPSDADKMYTAGNINKVFPSGVIDYKNDENAPGWRALRGDSAIITEVAKWRLDNDDGELSKEERDQLITLIEEEEEMLQDFETKVIDESGVKKDPPSFSKVPAAVLHLDKIKDEKLRKKLREFAEEKWPEFFKAKRMTAHLQPGEMLFLPAGWFHEVTSFGTTSAQNNIHIALNYWYSPPDTGKRVYSDDYWIEDFARTQASCEHFQ